MSVPLLHSIAIRTDCRQESYWFYNEVLGLVDVSFLFGFPEGASWLSLGGLLVELRYVPDDEMAPHDPIASGICQLNLMVPDLEAMDRRMSERDVKVDRSQDEVVSVAAPEGTRVQFREGAGGVPRLGIEPRTRNLKGCCSATELAGRVGAAGPTPIVQY